MSYGPPTAISPSAYSERNVAWHAGNWDYNTRSIGIEHEGWIDDPTWFTDPLYEQSALLTAAICDRYRIPKDREHIIGHVEVPGSDHTDPGEFWDWARYHPAGHRRLLARTPGGSPSAALRVRHRPRHGVRDGDAARLRKGMSRPQKARKARRGHRS